MMRQEKADLIEKELKKEEHKKKRNKIIKISIIIFSIILTLFIGLLVYMRKCGTKGLVVREYKIESNRLPDSFHGFKIVQFSDLHYLSTINKKEVNNLVNKINELKPDLVIFTGDLFDNNKEIKDDDINFLIEKFNSINVSVGKYLIKGDIDYNDNFNKVIDKTNFKLLNNKYELIYYNNDTPILLTGLGSSLNNNFDLDSSFSYDNINDYYTITIMHESDNIDSITNRFSVDLVLAGHSHNGQIRIPLIGPMIKFNGSKKYINSHYTINNTELYISGGLGTESNSFRWFNKPSINFYRLTKKAD